MRTNCILPTKRHIDAGRRLWLTHARKKQTRLTTQSVACVLSWTPSTTPPQPGVHAVDLFVVVVVRVAKTPGSHHTTGAHRIQQPASLRTQQSQSSDNTHFYGPSVRARASVRPCVRDLAWRSETGFPAYSGFVCSFVRECAIAIRTRTQHKHTRTHT